ncbi:hypothetical protein SDJN03_25148, partial [Cucurbita argyrosperma subsp. sororia]
MGRKPNSSSPSLLFLIPQPPERRFPTSPPTGGGLRPENIEKAASHCRSSLSVFRRLRSPRAAVPFGSHRIDRRRAFGCWMKSGPQPGLLQIHSLTNQSNDEATMEVLCSS